MRIAMIGWEFPPLVSGGLGTHCYELTKHLSEKGVIIDFYMPKVRYEVADSGANIVPVAFTPITPYAYPKREDFFQKVISYNEKCASLVVKGNYDIIHCHDWLTVPAGIKLKKTLRKPFVFTVHSTEYDRTANLFPWDRVVDIEKAGILHADRIITVSKRMKAQLIDRYDADERKIHVVYNGVDPRRFTGVKMKKPKERIVLYFGRLTVQKGPDFFLKAAKKVLEFENNVRFVVAGTGEMLTQLIDLTVKLGIQDKVFFTGYVSDEDLPKLYVIADVFVLPSVSEPFGIAPLEAMASGIPVIISKTTGVSEIVRNCLLVDFWDTNEMANKIIAVLRYEALDRTLREREKMEIMDKSFSWGNAAEETIRIYRGLL
ncbi:MAG: glycosyltransferase family 4 protein [Thermoplasmatales archaeon]|nr:glycosyltransferase family 4 protein [Thermoplasmatales archaeon]